MNPEPTGPPVLARRNPVAKLAGALLFTAVLLATLDPVTPALTLAIELAVVPLFGVRYPDLLRRAWPLAVAALGVLLSLIVFSTHRTGAQLVQLGPLDITSGVLADGLGLSLRLFAVAVPGVLVVASTDPTDLADALVQNVKASSRFAIGTLAAFRLLPLLGTEWQTLTLARRARGLDAGRSPIARVRLFGSIAFGLLVGAIRRGTRLATAMDARGFDSGVRRTVARRQRFGPGDAAFIAAAAVLAAAALATSVLLGTYRALF